MSPRGGYVEQARALIAIGRQAEAVPLLQRAVTDEPEAPFARCLLAACFIDLGRTQEALSMVDSALALQPESALAHRLRSTALRALGRRKAALSSAQEAVRLSPADPAALNVLAEAQLANKQVKEAWETGQRVVAAQPASMTGHVLLGRVALRRKQWKLAEAQFREALRIEPTSWVAMNNLGVALQGQRRTKEAIEAFENAARVNPRAELARVNLFRQTRRYLLPAAGLALFIALRLLAAAGANPLAIGGALLVLLGFGAMVYLRRRGLSQTVLTFYQLESRRQRLRTSAYLLGWYGGWIGIIVLGFVGFQLTSSGVFFIVLIAALIAWWFGWPRLWRNAIAPRFSSHNQ